MHLAAALLVGYMFFDFLPTHGAPADVGSSVSYRESGAGELTATFEPVDMGSVARGATRVQVAVLNLSASCDSDITIESIDIAHAGLGSEEDIRGVYLSDGFRRVSRVQRFDKNGDANMRMMSVTIPACSAIRLSVLVDLSVNAATGGEHAVMLRNASAIHASAKAVSLLAVDETKRVVATPYKAGTITVNFLPVSTRVRYGRTETVARIQLTADSGGSHYLHEFTLTNSENARDMDLTNFRLETRAGELLSGPATRMHGRTVRIPFDPSLLLLRSQTIVLLLKAEIRGSVTKKVRFELEEPGDLVSTLARER